MQSKIISNINLSTFMLDTQTNNLVLPGQPITSEEDFMKQALFNISGHGTYKHEGTIYASLVGTVEITNKLITVNAIKAKYTPQIGDIVIGRVVQIANKRWKIDINANADSYLNLNSAYITQQRKKNQQDQFSMRTIMQQGDYIVAQVQTSNADKTYNLHTRNPKYGKLQPGTLVQVSHKLIKKQKHHFVSFAPDNASSQNVGIVLGNNGNIWLSGYNRNAKQTEKTEIEKNKNIKNGQAPSPQVFKTISILYNLLQILCWEGLEISEPLLKQLYSLSVQKNIEWNQIRTQGKDQQIRQYLLDQIQERLPKRLEEMNKNLTRN